MRGTLYIVGTPIGNLGDMTNRAVQILDTSSLVLAEDTRNAKKLMTQFDVKTPLKSYHQHSNHGRKLEILNMLLNGEQIALVTDAGTPGISDPGNELVDFVYENSEEVEIVPIPGVSAVSTCLSVCGFNVQRYTFMGFVPKKKTSMWFKNLRELSHPVVYFDSAHRVLKNLEVVEEVFGDVQVFVGREMTKLHESYYRGKVSDVMGQLSGMGKIKGELTVVVNNTSNN